MSGVRVYLRLGRRLGVSVPLDEPRPTRYDEQTFERQRRPHTTMWIVAAVLWLLVLLCAGLVVANQPNHPGPAPSPAVAPTQGVGGDR